MRLLASYLDGSRPRIAVQVLGVSDSSSVEMYMDLVVGGRYRASIQRWVFPATVEKCQEMRQAWGAELTVTRELSHWYRQTSRAQQVQVEAGSQQDAVLYHVPQEAPLLFSELASDQRAGAAWIRTAYRGAGIFAPEMGVGKTRTVIAGLVERQVNGRILIVCPKISVRSVWGRELSKYTDWPVFLARGTRKQREKVLADFWAEDNEIHHGQQAQPRVLVIVAEMLRIKAKLKNHKIQPDGDGKSTFTGFEYPELFKDSRPWDAIVVDESQKLLASSSVVKNTLAGYGLKKLPQSISPTSLRLAVTATPYGDGGEVHGMFGTLHWCWQDEYTSFWNFAKENFSVTEKKVSRFRTINEIGSLKAAGGIEDFYRSLGPRVFRRTLEEVSPAHRGHLKYWVIDCEMSPKQEAQYREMSDNGEVMTSGGLLVANGVLATLTRARQLANGELVVVQVPTKRWVPVLDEAGQETDEEELVEEVKNEITFTGESGKLEALMQVLEEHGVFNGRGKRKMVIASQFNEFLYTVSDALDLAHVPYHMLTGATSDNKRDEMMNQFQSKYGPRVFLLNGKAGGVSITLDAADYMFQLDEMYPPEANEQLHRRIFRRSRVHKTHIVYFRTEGTVDENVAHNVDAKLYQQLKAMDARRGLSIVRDVIKYREPK